MVIAQNECFKRKYFSAKRYQKIGLTFNFTIQTTFLQILHREGLVVLARVTFMKKINSSLLFA